MRCVAGTLLIMGAAGVQGCSPRAAEPRTTRELKEAAWDTAWIQGGPKDTLLLMPIALAASEDHAYVLDAAAKRLLAFRLADGRLDWAAGSAGKGPEEFDGPVAVAVGPSGNIFVSDPGKGQIAVVSPEGRFLDPIPLRGIGYAQSLCALSDGDFLLSTLEAQPIVRLSPNGAVRQRLALPWPELQSSHAIARQAYLAGGSRSGGCVLAPVFGRGLAVYRDGKFRVVADYVEIVDAPSVQAFSHQGGGERRSGQRFARRTVGATSVTVVEDVAIVGFSGSSPAAGRILDRYSTASGAYIGSWTYSAPLLAVAQGGGRFLFLHYSAGYPTLVAAAHAAAPAQ